MNDLCVPTCAKHFFQDIDISGSVAVVRVKVRSR
jgi:hypothetical protein